MAVKTVLGDSTSYCRCVGWPGGAAALWVVAGVCVGGTWMVERADIADGAGAARQTVFPVENALLPLVGTAAVMK